MNVDDVRPQVVPLAEQEAEYALAEDASAVKLMDQPSRPFPNGQASMPIPSGRFVLVQCYDGNLVPQMNQSMGKIR